MATYDFSCPQCGNTSKVNDGLVGKKIRCKKCQQIMVVQAEGKATAIKSAKPPAKKKDKDDDDRVSYTMREENLAARCPHCAQLMDPPDARICLHCGYDLQKRERKASKLTVEHAAPDYILWHLPTFGCFVADMTLITIVVLCVWNRSDWFDFTDVIPAGCWATWIVVVCLFFMFLATRFIVRRLVWNFTPPEKEYKLEED